VPHEVVRPLREDAQGVARAHDLESRPFDLLDLVAVHPGAVVAAEVFDRPGPFVKGDPHVMAGHAAVGELYAGEIPAPQHQLPVIQRDGSLERLALGEDHDDARGTSFVGRTLSRKPRVVDGLGGAHHATLGASMSMKRSGLMTPWLASFAVALAMPSKSRAHSRLRNSQAA
jgi:hypothetical protein